MFKRIRKRDNRIVKFDAQKITNAIAKAGKATEEFDEKIARMITLKVLSLAEQLIPRKTPTVEEIQDIVEEVLLSSPYRKTAKAYIIYREQHARIRDIVGKSNVDLVDQYLQKLDWQVNENSNMAFSLQGLNNYISSEISQIYWLNKIYPAEIRDAHISGDFHIHDLNILSVYCVGWDLFDLLVEGFKGVPGKVESKPAKHFRSALGQIVNFFYTLQGEAAGAQAFSNLDTLLSPFIRYDGLSYTEVKQALQEFIFNINVPTRVGFQCLSEDTEILTPDGWAGYEDIKAGQLIKTFNIQTGSIEDQPVKNMFSKPYTGKMYNLKNRIQDQLISPGHRVVRRKFNTNEAFVLEEIEKVVTYKSPVIIPITGKNTNPDKDISDDEIRLLAWIIAEGSKESYTRHRHSHRITIYQSRTKSPQNYNEITGILDRMELTYSNRESVPALGTSSQMIRLNAESSQKLLDSLFKTRQTVKFIPDILKNMSRRQARLFLDTYLKADGHEGSKITTTNIEILNGLQQLTVDAGYGFTVGTRNPTIGKRTLYILRLIDHQDTYIQTIKKIDYSGVIWCPSTVNETVIARRNGKVFITGNTPFTNVTLDLTVPEYFLNQPVIIGGKMQNDTYKEFQKEMDMFNKAFLEVMLEGDARGRVFTFPIPTYNISKDFNWENSDLNILWEVTAKYGVPYFSNFINSDMNPEDARSMCCRLRIDNRSLEKKGGGLFGSNPLTGSIGVVTLNMPRLAYLSDDEHDFFVRLEPLMVMAKQALEIKRKVLERLTEGNLYPYARYYLRNIKEHLGSYWKNHFSTIGLLGMNEACINLLGKSIASPAGQKFSCLALDFMRSKLIEFQQETQNNYNLEATPAEGTSYRLARKDKDKFPQLMCANEDSFINGGEPFYTNSTQLPVNYTDDVFEALDLQDEIQSKYTGGTVLHIFAGERVEDPVVIKKLIRKICENYHIPYFTFTPVFSVCPSHGYLSGEQEKCPECGAQCEIYSRVVGYLRPLNQWNKGKQEEFALRKTFKV